MLVYVFRMVFIVICLVQVCFLQGIPLMLFHLDKFGSPLDVWSQFLFSMLIFICGAEALRTNYVFLKKKYGSDPKNRLAIALFPFVWSGIILFLYALMNNAMQLSEMITLIFACSVVLYLWFLIGLFFHWLFIDKKWPSFKIDSWQIIIINIVLAALMALLSQTIKSTRICTIFILVYCVFVLFLDFFVIHRILPDVKDGMRYKAWFLSIGKELVAGVFVFLFTVFSTTILSRPQANYYVIPYGSFSGKVLIIEAWNHQADSSLIPYFFGIDKRLINSMNKWNGRTFVYDANDKSVVEKKWSIKSNELINELVLINPLYLPSCKRLVTNVNVSWDPRQPASGFNVYNENGDLEYRMISKTDVDDIIPTDDCKIFLIGERNGSNPFVSLLWDVGNNKTKEPKELNKYRIWMYSFQPPLRGVGNDFIFKGNPQSNYDINRIYYYKAKKDRVESLYSAQGPGIFFDISSNNKIIGMNLLKNALPSNQKLLDGHSLVRFISIDNNEILKQFELKNSCINFLLQPETDNILCSNFITIPGYGISRNVKMETLDFKLYDQNGNIIDSVKIRNVNYSQSYNWIDRNHLYVVVGTESTTGGFSISHDSFIVDIKKNRVLKASDIIKKYDK